MRISLHPRAFHVEDAGPAARHYYYSTRHGLGCSRVRAAWYALRYFKNLTIPRY